MRQRPALRHSVRARSAGAAWLVVADCSSAARTFVGTLVFSTATDRNRPSARAGAGMQEDGQSCMQLELPWLSR